MKAIYYKFVCFSGIFLIVCFLAAGCQQKTRRHSFEKIGDFSIRILPNNCKELRDGLGRVLLLVPRGQAIPKGYASAQVVRIPVRRVVAYSGYMVSLLRAIHAIDSLVGVTHVQDYWLIPEVREGLEKGRISYVGESAIVDFEKLKAVRPELVFTWDASLVPKLEELHIPIIITTTGEAMNLDTRLNLVRFVAQFFGKEKVADEYVKRVRSTIARIKKIVSKKHGTRPKVIWGDIYEKRVLVEPGNSWAAQMVKLAGGKYLFDDIRGSS